jgi:hypothetical protein
MTQLHWYPTDNKTSQSFHLLTSFITFLTKSRGTDHLTGTRILAILVSKLGQSDEESVPLCFLRIVMFA